MSSGRGDIHVAIEYRIAADTHVSSEGQRRAVEHDVAADGHIGMGAVDDARVAEIGVPVVPRAGSGWLAGGANVVDQVIQIVGRARRASVDGLATGQRICGPADARRQQCVIAPAVESVIDTLSSQSAAERGRFRVRPVAPTRPGRAGRGVGGRGAPGSPGSEGLDQPAPFTGRESPDGVGSGLRGTPGRPVGSKQ